MDSMELIKPQNKRSREAVEEDIRMIEEAAKQMEVISKTPVGVYANAVALAHTQVEEKDPIRFFIMQDGETIVNPVIKRHSSYEIEKEEGCYTFPLSKPKVVKRFQKCEVEYDKIVDGVLEYTEESLTGKRAEIFQHEIDHMDGIDMYTK